MDWKFNRETDKNSNWIREIDSESKIESVKYSEFNVFSQKNNEFELNSGWKWGIQSRFVEHIMTWKWFVK